jgi:hypothetical protein
VVFRKLAELMRSLAIHGHDFGGAGQLLDHTGFADGMRAIGRSRDWRIQRFRSIEALHTTRPRDSRTRRAGREQYAGVLHQDEAHPFVHDLTIDNSRFNLAQIAEIVFTALGARFGETLVSA